MSKLLNYNHYDKVTFGDLSLNGDASFNNDVFVNNNLVTNNDIQCNNRLFILGDASLNNDVYVKETIIVDGDASLNANLRVSNDATLNQRLFVLGDASLNSDLYIKEMLLVDGDVSLNSNLKVLGDASFNNRLFVSNDASFNNDVFVSNNLVTNNDIQCNNRLFVLGDVSWNPNNLANDCIPSTAIIGGAGGSSSFSQNGDDIYFNNGNVGIGTSTPSDKLTITDGNLTITDGNLSLTNGDLKASFADSYAWNNYGQIISGVYESDNNVGLGVRVDMDANGLTIVAGAYAETTSELTGEGVAYVYKYDSNADIWYQHGSKIEFGAGCVGLSISSDGTIVAIAGYTGPAAGETYGRVRVYQYNSSSNTWEDYGTNQSIMEGQVSGERVGLRGFGASKDGNTVAFTERDGTNGVHVFRIVSGAWTKIGTFESSNYANSSLNYDGSRIVFIDFTNQTGLVYDYSGSGTTWNQVGTTITHTGSNDPASYTAINKEGNVIALNEHTNQTVSIYSFDTASNDWVQKGQTFTDSEGSGGLFGQAPMRFSSDGNKIAITNNNNGSMYLYTYVHPFWEQSNQFVGTYTSTNFTISIGADDNITKIVGGGYAGDLNGTDSGYVQAWQWSQKTYTNPTLDVSGRTVSVWGNAEHSASNYTYSQLGSTLTGASSGIDFATGMDMDSTGTIWAIADKYNTNVGSVHVYKYRNSAWSQMGSTIYGTHGEDFFGDDAHRLSLSGDGKVLVVGASAGGNFYTSGGTRVYGYVNTYHYVNGDWVLFGETSGYNTSVSIVPTTNHTSSTLFGASVSTNNDGTVLAIGEYNGVGKGGIWRYNSSTDSWNNEFIFPYRTSGVGISKDGTRVVTGYEGSDINVGNDGSLRVYNYNSSTQSWSQLGSTLTGYETQDRVGYRVAISGDGNTIVHCASNESSSGNSFAQVYTYIQAANGGNGDWVQKGTDFVGSTSTRYGWACKLDYDGDTVILGSPYYDVGRIYKYINGIWEQVGPDFTFGGNSGSSTALSDDGMTFAVGAQGTTNGSAGAYILSKVEGPILKIQDGNIGIGTADTTTYDSATTSYADGIKFDQGNVSVNNGILYLRNGVTPGTNMNFETIWGHTIDGGNDYRSWTHSNGYLYIDSGNNSRDLLLCAHMSGGGGITSNGYQWCSKGHNASSIVFQTHYYHSSNGTMYNEYLSLGIATRPSGYRFYVNGDAGGTSTWASSDDRIKHNEEPITNALETIRKLKPKHYIKTIKLYDANHNFELDASGNPIGEPIYDASGNQTGTETHDALGNPTYYLEDGLIAQELLEIPELKFCFKEGETGDDATMPHGVNYNNIFVRSIKALQELDEIVQADKARIASLESENATLKTQVADILARLSALENN